MKDNRSIFPNRMSVAQAEVQLSIAIVYSRLPLPMIRADQMTVAHLIEFFAARGHYVDLYTLDNGEPILSEQIKWLNSRCRNIYLFKQGKLRSLTGVLFGLLHGLPLQIGWFYNTKQIQAVQSAYKKGKYDIAYSYYIRSAETLRGLSCSRSVSEKNQCFADQKKSASFLAMQLCQSLNTRRIVKNCKNLRDLIIYSIESKLLRRYEARIWSEFTRTVLIGQKDVNELCHCCREQGLPEVDNYIFGPHGVDTKHFSPRADVIPDSRTLVFSGVMMTNTNVNAITWFAKHVFPEVKKAMPLARLIIVGRNPTRDVMSLSTLDGIEVTGEVEDPADYIARATVCINPVKAAAGMQNKLLEYFAMGKSVVATSNANEGIGACNGEQLLIANSSKEFASSVLRLLQDPELRSTIGRAARHFVETSWTWEAHFHKLEHDMLAAIMEN